MTDRLNIHEVFRLAVDFFGMKLRSRAFDDAALTVSGVLYETFELRLVLDDQHGSFGAAILVGRSLSTSEFFGKRVSRNPDRQSIATSLATVDRWCRAHLSSEFLAEYEANLADESR